MRIRRSLGAVALGCAALLVAAGSTEAIAQPGPPHVAAADTGDEDTSTDTSPDLTPISPGTLLRAPLVTGAGTRDLDARAAGQGPPRPSSARGSGDQAKRPYYKQADWLWDPIPADPVLDPDSAAVGAALGTGVQVANLKAFATTLRTVGKNSDIPRYDVEFKYTGEWGPDPFGDARPPIPINTPLPTGSDKHLAIMDKATGMTFNMWMAKPTPTGWKAGWGAMAPIDGDGRETMGGSSTGSGLARFGAVVRAKEITDGEIPHALFFSTDMAAETVLRYPAVKTDGSNDSGSPVTIPEGARVQLDPAIDLAAIPGITPFELTVGRALQRYGAYCGDNGGARMAFIFEYVPKLKPYKQAGADGDYYNMPHLPWDELRVLRQSDGS
jgi:hypothetical protein